MTAAIISGLRPGDHVRVDGDWPETSGRLFRVLFAREDKGTVTCRGSDSRVRVFPVHDVAKVLPR